MPGDTSFTFPFRVAVSFKYGAEAIALLGIAYGMIKWVGRSLRSLISDERLEESRIEALAASTPGAAADMLMRRGIISAEQLSGMSEKERQFLLDTAAPKLGARGTRPTPPVGDPAVGRAPTPLVAASPRPTPTRLHLITPTRPPLGLAVHCPGCGTILDRDALQRFGSATCERCKRQVSAHIQRGRITVIVEETTEEGEYRRRMEGEH